MNPFTLKGSSSGLWFVNAATLALNGYVLLQMSDAPLACLLAPMCFLLSGASLVLGVLITVANLEPK